MSELERQSIYFESGDEITSAVDKIKSAESNTLDIVIPKEALLLQSVVNLKLLKRQAENLGKEITIVTQDRVGKKLAEQIGIPVVAKEGETPKVMNVSENDETVKDIEPTEEDIEFKDKEYPSAGAQNDKKKQEAIEETSEVIGEVKQVKPTGKEKLKGWAWIKAHWKGFSVAVGFGLLLLAMAAYVYVPLAKVNISFAAQKESIDIIFVADTSARSVDAETQTIPAEKIEENIEKTEEFKATGEKDVGEKATGKAKICNAEDSDAFTLNAGSKLINGNLTYKTTANIQVPGASVGGGEIVKECSAEVSIQAAEVGPTYNKDAASVAFSIPALSGNYSAESTTTITGGTSEKVKYVTAEDIASAKESIQKTAEDELRKKIIDGLDGKQLLEGSLDLKETESKANVAAGAEKETFSYTYKADGKAIVFSEDDLLSLAEQVLSNKIGDGREIVEKDSLVSEAKATKVDFEEGVINATFAGEAYIATKIDEEDFKIQVSGVTESEAYDYINNLDGVESVEINFFPNFYKRMPRIKSHIYIKVEISKMQNVQEDNKTEDEKAP